jgi:hypothetical protein
MNVTPEETVKAIMETTKYSFAERRKYLFLSFGTSHFKNGLQRGLSLPLLEKPVA